MDGQKKPRKSNIAAAAIVGVLLFGLVVILAFLGHRSSPAQDSGSTLLGLGDRGVLSAGEATLIYLAADETTYESLRNSILAGDSVGVAELLLHGQAFDVPAGTRVLIIDTHTSLLSSARRVRVVAVPSADAQDKIGLAGWVSVELVKPEEP